MTIATPMPLKVRAAAALELKRRKVGGSTNSLLAHYRINPVAFVREVLRAEPTPYQCEILMAFVEKRRVAVRGPHGLGKTALSAWLVLWAIAVHDTDVKVVTTASAWRQLTKFTWPEITRWARKADWTRIGLTVRIGKELLTLSLGIGDRQAFAVASDNPALIEGAHASIIFYIFDEAKAIPNGTWDAAEGAFSAGQAYALAISTPGEPSGRFYDIHAHKPGLEDWHAIHVTLLQAIQAGRISPEWAEQRAQQWGEQSAVYQNRVLGEFADSGEDSVVPLAWVELANERWRDTDIESLTGRESYGVDVARYGTDKTAICKMIDTVCVSIDTYSKQDTMQTAGRVAALVDKRTPVAVDVIGVGAGVVDRLRELDYQVIAVNVGEGTNMTDSSGKIGFINLRSALWWILREALDPNGSIRLALPPEDELTGDLTAPAWVFTSAGKIKVESKDDIRARIGRSTDYADALALAVWAWMSSGMKISYPADTPPSKVTSEDQAATFALRQIEAMMMSNDQDDDLEPYLRLS